MGAGKRAVAVGALATTVALAGCSVHVNKNGNGDDKDVAIHTPFGGMQVHKNKGGAEELGLPAYPGASLASDSSSDSKSVDVQMGFGKWQMHVQVANYVTGDPQAKVQEFYRKAMARYGEVLTCQGSAPVGTPARTAEGLTCADNGEAKNVHVARGASLELKAGSQHRQHIVAFDNKKQPGTHFALVALALPSKGSSGDDAEE